MWRRGDKAACVWKSPVNDQLEVGRVYTVAGVSHCTCVHWANPTDVQCLLLVDLPVEGGNCPTCGAEAGWFSDRFRKVVDDKQEAGEECPALLDLTKKREKVDA